jgi:hypothetical protein
MTGFERRSPKLYSQASHSPEKPGEVLKFQTCSSGPIKAPEFRTFLQIVVEKLQQPHAIHDQQEAAHVGH